MVDRAPKEIFSKVVYFLVVCHASRIRVKMLDVVNSISDLVRQHEFEFLNEKLFNLPQIYVSVISN
jgi:hypothetical protein